MSEKRDRYEFLLVCGVGRIILAGLESVCTACGMRKPFSEFGLRLMKQIERPDGSHYSGELRSQPQCKPCRARYSKKDVDEQGTLF